MQIKESKVKRSINDININELKNKNYIIVNANIKEVYEFLKNNNANENCIDAAEEMLNNALLDDWQDENIRPAIFYDKKNKTIGFEW